MTDDEIMRNNPRWGLLPSHASGQDRAGSLA